MYKRVISHLKLFFPAPSVIEHSGRIIQVNVSYDRVLNLPLGFSEKMLSSYVSYGMNIIPELSAFSALSKPKLDYTFAELVKNDQVSSIMFSKEFNFGDVGFLDYLNLKIQRSDYKLIFPEFSNVEFVQADRFTKMASQMASQVVVSHGALKKDQKENHSLSFDKLFNRYSRALSERSPHVLIMAPINSMDIPNLYDKNILFMRKVIETYERSGGSRVDYFLSLSKIEASFFERAIIGLGIFSSVFLIILKVHRITDRWQYLVLISGLSILYTTILAISKISVVVFGLMAVIVGPTFAMIYFFPSSALIYTTTRRQKLFLLIKYLTQIIAVCMVSVVYCVSLYSAPMYLQNVVPFRGVKLALFLPVLLVGLYFYCGDRRANSIYYVLRRIFRFPLTLFSVVVFFTGIMVIILYIFRSGNYLQLSQFEASIRIFLEDVFLIRPRFKEFLIGYPALLFGFWFADRKLKDKVWLLNSLGVIALASFVNSFCHFHTPILISLYRSFFGLFIGCVLSVVFYYFYFFSSRIIKSLSIISK